MRIGQKGPACRQAGFSLIELILVVFIVGSIILLIINIPNSIKLVGNSKNESIAKAVAIKKIEDLRSLGYSNLGDGETQISDLRLKSIPQGTASYIISPCPSTPPDIVCQNNEEIKMVEVKVSWKEEGKVKEFKLTTLISQGGLK